MSVFLSQDREEIEGLYGPAFWVRNVPWLIRNRILSPLVLPHALPDFTDSEIRKVLEESGALIAWWTDQWDRKSGDWYWICCDDANYSEASVRNSRYRKLVRKGNKLGEVRKINPEDHLESLHSLIARAVESYDDSRTELEEFESFKEGIETKYRSGDYEFWGYFSETNLVAYCECLKLGDAVRLISGKSDYAYRSSNPNNALFYQVTQHYLAVEKFRYVTNGQKTLHHPSNVNTLFENLGYRRIYCRPRLMYSKLAKPLAMGLSNPIGSQLAKVLPLPKSLSKKLTSLQAVVEVEKANRG